MKSIFIFVLIFTSTHCQDKSSKVFNLKDLVKLVAKPTSKPWHKPQYIKPEQQTGVQTVTQTTQTTQEETSAENPETKTQYKPETKPQYRPEPKPQYKPKPKPQWIQEPDIYIEQEMPDLIIEPGINEEPWDYQYSQENWTPEPQTKPHRKPNNNSKDGNYWISQKPQQNSPYYDDEPFNNCPVIPEHARTFESSPIVTVEMDFNDVLVCDSDSVFSEISYTGTYESSATCNGILVDRGEDIYDVLIGPERTIKKIYVTNYTQMLIYNNGNSGYSECGTISGGSCDGDILWGIGSYRVNDQDGCKNFGVRSTSAIIRQIEIFGKCASRCSLGTSLILYSVPFNNYGLVKIFSKSNQANID